MRKEKAAVLESNKLVENRFIGKVFFLFVIGVGETGSGRVRGPCDGSVDGGARAGAGVRPAPLAKCRYPWAGRQFSLHR